MQKYVSSLDVDVDTQYNIQQYLKLIQKKASGQTCFDQMLVVYGMWLYCMLQVSC